MSLSYGINVSEEEKDLHPIFKTDPNFLWNFVNKKVLLTTSEALVFEGWVYTIDPVTHSWVLFTGETRGNFSIQLVMNSAVTTAKVLEDICPDNILDVMTQYGGSKKVDLDESALVKRRDAVCRWFGVNRIMVSKSGNALSVANGVLSIEPPYLPENCCSSNEIILSRIRNLLNSMPESDNMDT